MSNAYIDEAKGLGEKLLAKQSPYLRNQVRLSLVTMPLDVRNYILEMGGFIIFLLTNFTWCYSYFSTISISSLLKNLAVQMISWE